VNAKKGINVIRFSLGIFIIFSCFGCGAVGRFGKWRRLALNSEGVGLKKLESAPGKIKYYNEIAVKYDDAIVALYNELKPEERIFSYYLLRASLPGNRILSDQCHRYSIAIIEMLENILKRKDILRSVVRSNTPTLNIDGFLQDVETYLVYLWTNHGPYFSKEHFNEKRTPTILGLKYFTEENLIEVLRLMGHVSLRNEVKKMAPFIFNDDVEPTLTIPDNIEASAINIYSPDFLDSDYSELSLEERESLNRYFYIDQEDQKRQPKSLQYKVGGKFSKELEIACYWIEKAHKHAKKYPESFDGDLVKSLEYLIAYLQTGDEELFRKFSIEWLKSNSKIDFNFGFIEQYKDPKATRGMFEAEATIKSVNITKINSILPELEDGLPIPQEFKRENLTAANRSIPNASINTKIFGAGDLGPMNITAAYCLPNYEDIRSKYGSKQIIYQPEKSIAELVNPQLNIKLFYLSDQAGWLQKNDPDLKLKRDLWTLHVILHETIGHGSGQLAEHTFVEDDKLNIGGKTYNVGDIIKVTAKNLREFLAGYDSTIEELRAEIVAMYISSHHLDDINNAGFLVDWTEKLGKEKMIEWLLWDIANDGFRRLLTQDENATEISGDHARANLTILNYLADNRGIEIIEEEKIIDGEKYTVLGCKVMDMQKAKNAVKDLMILVQTIKSTGDGLAAKKLIDTYGKKIKKQEYIKIAKDNLKAVSGDVKVTASIYPNLTPVFDEENNIIDIQAGWPSGIVEQQLEYSKLALSKI
jgi:dipeptidyl-peptidase III